MRSSIPEKKPKKIILSSDAETNKKKVSSDRIIVKNVFGRLCTLWALIGRKWR